MPREELKLSMDLLIKLKDEGKTQREIAKILNCSLSSIYRRCKKHGIKFRKGPEKNKRWSSFSKWLKENPDVTLPHSVSKIAEITGCTEKAIKNYIGRERWRSRDLIKAKPWEQASGIIWKSTRGFEISDRAFKDVHGAVSWTGRMRFTVELKDKSVHIFLLSAKQLEEMYE